ncbi:MAG: hypothetical protein FWC17_04890, partial [Treponema sp.]|nr:hypothetical protein [Treponema sp.]
MKKAIITVILILCACFIVYGQSSSVDLILVLDTSQGMSSSYENVNNYLTGDFLKEFLRVGDTFHLIAFSDSQRLDVARRINGFGDVETIVGRMLLQYPVEAGRNVQSALSFAEQYASSLPSRPKKIVLVTLAGTDAANLVSATKQRLGSGTTLDYIEVTPGRPLTNLPASGRSAVISAPVSSSPSGAAPAASPGTASNTAASSGTAGTASNAPSSAVTPAAGTASVPADNTAGIIPPPAVSAADTTTTTSSGITPETQTPSQVSQTPASTSGTGNVSGQTTASQTNAPSAPSASDSSGSSLASSLPLIIGLIIAALLILGLIIFFVTRKLSSSPNRVMS